ncbi:hypothetical protein C7T35_01490 [Variovorax sp. WS11]|uniref:hypothetical protein n=1 Tax=Variovorax sp. WS11 TaxID=1105204 RepID=UPI000D0DEC90|nr:hypothetical protein [Variovorax sp. WS11]NDZ11473.1 hypothetical protein [Variovorax sp. WS11]PSL86668.1 hypothetical protein C7T35_01490 [Variovorax sp. WS11]
MIPVTKWLIIGLGILLGLSALTNIGLTKAYLKARDAKTQAIADRDSARGAATACSDATEALAELSNKRHDQGEAARQAAEKKAASWQKLAQGILTSPPKVPGNVCASAQAEVDEELAGRAP